MSTFRKELQKFIFNCLSVLILYRLSIRSFIVVITHCLPSFLSFLLQKKRSIFLLLFLLFLIKCYNMKYFAYVSVLGDVIRSSC